MLAGFLTLLFVVVAPFDSFADNVPTPNGEIISGWGGDGATRFKYNKKIVVIQNTRGDSLDSRSWFSYGEDIDWVVNDTKNTNKQYYSVLVFFTDGKVSRVKYSRNDGYIQIVDNMPQRPEFFSVKGDALYGLALTGVPYVSRDTSATWQIDSTGIGAG